MSIKDQKPQKMLPVIGLNRSYTGGVKTDLLATIVVYPFGLLFVAAVLCTIVLICF